MPSAYRVLRRKRELKRYWKPRARRISQIFRRGRLREQKMEELRNSHEWTTPRRLTQEEHRHRPQPRHLRHLSTQAEIDWSTSRKRTCQRERGVAEVMCEEPQPDWEALASSENAVRRGSRADTARVLYIWCTCESTECMRS